jgi:hypothetical protein
MGMDVFGRNPDSKAGEYFRANVWSWRPIHDLIIWLCSDLLDEETLESLSYNAGAGAEDQETCTQMANRFDQWMEHNVEGHDIEIEGMQVTPEGRFVSEQELTKNPELETVTPYETDDEHLKEWIEFLRHCGRFRVC